MAETGETAILQDMIQNQNYDVDTGPKDKPYVS